MTKLREVSEIITKGTTPTTIGEKFVEVGINYVKSESITHKKYLDNTLFEHITEETHKKLKRSQLEEDDLLFSIAGAYLGKVGKVRSEDLPLNTNQAVGIVRLKKNLVDVDYVYYYFSQKKVNDYVNVLSSQSGQPNLNLELLGNLEFANRDLSEQKRIGMLLSLLDDKIQTNNKINAELELIAKAIYDFWFLQYEFPNEDGKPYKSSGGKMVWHEELKREIPEGWEVDFLGRLFTSKRGISYNSKSIEGNGVPMINLASFNVDGSYKEEGIKVYSGEYSEEKVVRPFDLLMCNTQQTAIDYKKDIIGKAFLVPDIFEGDIVTSHHVTTIQVKKDNMKYFLHRLFNTDYFHKYAAGFTNGTNILGLIFSGIEKYRLEIPDDAVLEKFADLMLDIEKKKSKIIKENQELFSLRDFLLPLLMNGQVGFKA